MMRALALAFLLASCAAPPERYLTQEQDNEFRNKCVAHGCVIVPIPLWLQMMEALKSDPGVPI